MGALRSSGGRGPLLGLVLVLGACRPPGVGARPEAESASPSSTERAASLWALDGLHGELVGLDAGLAPVRRAPLAAGVELLRGPRLFVLGEGGRRVQARDPHDGGLRAERTLGEPARGMALCADELVLLLGAGARARLVFLGPDLEPREVAPLPGAYLLAGSGAELVVARRGGRLARCRGRPLAVVAEARLRGRVTAASLDPAAEALVVRVGARRVARWRLAPGQQVRREARLVLTWERRFTQALAQVVADGAGGAWCVLADGSALRLGPRGEPSAAVERLPCRRVVDACGMGDGRLLLACVGALVELDGGGRATRAQGGFGELLALAAR